ncbi:hypothetical protein [Enterococcus gallinarum]
MDIVYSYSAVVHTLTFANYLVQKSGDYFAKNHQQKTAPFQHLDETENIEIAKIHSMTKLAKNCHDHPLEHRGDNNFAGFVYFHECAGDLTSSLS